MIDRQRAWHDPGAGLAARGVPWQLLVVALGYWLAGQLSTLVSSGPGVERMIWLPSGVALAAMLAWGRGMWPAVALGGAATGLALGLNTTASLVIGAAASLEALAASFILVRLGFDPQAVRLREAMLFVVVALGCALVGPAAEYGVAVLQAGASADRQPTWWFAWVGHALGMLLLTPLLLRSGSRDRDTLSAGRQLELLVLAAATVGLSLAVFTAMGDPHMFNPMSYALFPLLLWAVLRFGPRQAAAMLLLIALVAAWGTAGGNGPFALPGPEASAGSLYLYLSVATVATLALTSSIAERSRVAEALAASEHQYRELVETMNEGVIAVDAQARVRFANGPFARMAGAPVESLVGEPVARLIRGGRAHWPGRADAGVEELDSFDAQLERADGTRLEISVSPRVVRDESSRTSGWLAVIADIAERRRTDDILRWIARATAPLTGEALLRELMRHMAGAFRLECAFVAECVKTQPALRMRVLACWRGSGFVAPAEFELAGTPGEDTVHGWRVMRIRDPLGEPLPAAHGSEARSCLGVQIMDCDGNRVIGHVAFVSNGPGDEAVLTSPLFQILTSRAAAELRRQRAEDQARQHLQQLAQVSRALALGEMGTAIAHELNQPLAAVVNYAHACRRLLDAGGDEQEIKRAMQRIADQAERAGQILRRLRGFLAPGAATAAPADLGTLTHEIIDLAQPEARQREVELRIELQPDLPRVNADAIQVQQVILNLVRNAIEATATSDTPHRWVKLMARRSQDGVAVAVTDNGPGVPSAMAERVFEPFFTTKTEGTGIGLSISRSIVEAHGGRLSLEKSGVGGACFTFWLPHLGGRDAR